MKTQIAVVSGGTRGIGWAIAERLVKDGYFVRMLYRADTQAAARAAAAIGESGDAQQVDVGDAEAVERFRQETCEMGQVKAVVHSAFRSGRKPVKTHELDPAAWQEDLGTNLGGPFILTRAFLPTMLEHKHGRIVFIGSLAMRGESGRVAYATAKNGLVGLAKTIGYEYARHGITANVVSPGYIDAGAFQRLSDQIREGAAQSIPAKRLGTALEVAEAVAYFAGDLAGYTTGQVLGVDGAAR